jgi:putative ABC transport system substrate-binding protein
MVVFLSAAVLLLAGSLAAQPQPAARMYRIGYVGTNPPVAEAFRQGLRDAGYIEGKNVVIEARFAEGREERLPELVAQVLRLKIDVLVSVSTPAALAAKKANTTIPVVFASVTDPVASGLVASLARPGGNITGASIGVSTPGFGGKWVELLKEAVPGVSQAAVLWNPAGPNTAQFVRDIQAAAQALNVKVDLLGAGNAAELDRAIVAIGVSRAQAIIVVRDLFFNSTATRVKLVQFAANKRLPAVYSFKSFVADGGLMSYAASQEESYRGAATLVDRIFKGAKPAELPIQQPTRFELVINLRAARALGLTIPPSLLLRADQVIE